MLDYPWNFLCKAKKQNKASGTGLPTKVLFLKVLLWVGLSSGSEGWFWKSFVWDSDWCWRILKRGATTDRSTHTNWWFEMWLWLAAWGFLTVLWVVREEGGGGAGTQSADRHTRQKDGIINRSQALYWEVRENSVEQIKPSVESCGLAEQKSGRVTASGEKPTISVLLGKVWLQTFEERRDEWRQWAFQTASPQHVATSKLVCAGWKPVWLLRDASWCVSRKSRTISNNKLWPFIQLFLDKSEKSPTTKHPHLSTRRNVRLIKTAALVHLAPVVLQPNESRTSDGQHVSRYFLGLQQLRWMCHQWTSSAAAVTSSRRLPPLSASTNIGWQRYLAETP